MNPQELPRVVKKIDPMARVRWIQPNFINHLFNHIRIFDQPYFDPLLPPKPDCS